MEKQAPLRTSAFSAEAAWQLLQLHRPALALELADRLLAHNPFNIQALGVRTEALGVLHRLPEAISTARQAVAIAPQNAYTHAALAWVYGQQGNLWAAVDTIQEALRLNPISAEYYALLAQLQYLLRRPDETVGSANRGLAINARHPDCLLWRALAEEQLNEPTAADLHFQQLFRLAPNNASAHAHRGKQLLRRCEPAQAATHLAAALQLAPARSAELVPLLRQARREQHWPTWMVRRRQQLRQEWQARGWLIERGAGTLLLLPFFAAYGWWHTRHDPLFQLSRTQVLRRWQKAWVGSIFLLPVLGFLAGYFKIINLDAPFSMVQMVSLVVGNLLYLAVGYLLGKRIKQQP